MSREVEVQNIQMTATVPEDLQISPGWTTASKSTNGTQAYDINGDSSFLGSGVGGTKSYAKTPDAENLQMWSNTLDISHYYSLGKIIPASSTSGASIFFTPDANGVGKTVKEDAIFYLAGDTAGGSGATDSGSTKTYKTTLFANSGTTTLSGSYSGASAYNMTNDDGYYVDIPLWIRSSSDKDVNLDVAAYVVPYKVNDSYPSGSSEADIELYKAARVVILPDTTDGKGSSGTKGLIDLKDGSGSKNYTGASVLDWYTSGTHGRTDKSNLTSGAVSKAGSGSGVFAQSTISTGEKCLTVKAKGSGKQYGEATKFWVRVWLEGEDPECWNQNAGQNFSINLKFTKNE